MPTPGLTQEEQDFLDREIRRGKLWGPLTFGQVMDTLDRQYDALALIRTEAVEYDTSYKPDRLRYRIIDIVDVALKPLT